MKLVHLIGVNHFDPFGRDNIITLLRKLKTEGFSVDYIAVEWAKTNAEVLLSNRSLFAQKAREVFLSFSDFEINQLANTLAYEADCAQEVFPEASIIWLDEARNQDVNAEQYINDRINTYNKYYVTLDDKTLVNLRNCFIRIADAKPSPSKRDLDFYHAIEKALGEKKSNIVGIVGANHIQKNVDGVFAQLLSSNGYDLIVYDMQKEMP